MKPENALAILDQAVAQINGSRQLHVQLQQAVACLQAHLSSTAPQETHKEGEDVESQA